MHYEGKSAALIVSVGGQTFGLPVRDVAEVLDNVSITPVPGVAATVRGVVRYDRGVVAVVPLSRIVGVETNHESARATVVVVRSNDSHVAIEVDDAIEVVDATGDRWSAGFVEYGGTRVRLVDVQRVAADLDKAEVVAT